MCGIVGIIGRDADKAAAQMLQTIVHRGPDRQGLDAVPEEATLGIQRLSIVDQAAGNQPFRRSNPTQISVCNGEIYNSQQLRNELRPSLELNTATDVEVIPALYRRFGAKFIPTLQGMFAFIIYDKGTNDFLAVRDRFGIKPLYYTHQNQKWYFASEAKAFLVAGCNLELVREVPPGSFLDRSGVHRWFTITQMPMHADPQPAALRQCLEDSVERHLQADEGIKFGVFLSGGLDSSGIAAMISRRKPDVVAFTVGMDGMPDLAAARSVAKHLGIRLVECRFTLAEMEGRLKEAVRTTESWNVATVLEGLLTMLLAEAAAAEGIRVVFSGEGADELFCGYGFLREANFDDRRVLLENIGKTECRRLDRATMAYSVEGRVPFLDADVVNLALGMPQACLVQRSGDVTIGKWILRQAFRDLLPPEIVGRVKIALDHGSGILGLVDYISTDPLYKGDLNAHLFELWRDLFGNLGGFDAFAMFGNYPIMQKYLLPSTYRIGGGTGDTVEELRCLHQSSSDWRSANHNMIAIEG